MIPAKLKMRNFMCYRDNVSELSFDGVHIACLCGANGYGKSAIFDAMTWALWGESRARSDDDLVSIGQKEAEVDLEFLVQKQRYRVIRKRIRRASAIRQGQSSLEFQIMDNNVFKSITGNNMTETQAKITSVIHMDYDTFVNSAFLRQGNSNEFSNKKPAERKEVLGNILGLSIYGKYEDDARESIQQRKNMIESLELANQNSVIQIARKDELLKIAEKISQELETVVLQGKNQEHDLSILRQQKQIWELQKEKLLSITNRLKEIKVEISKWQMKKTESEQRIEKHRALIEQKDIIEKKYDRLQKVREQDNELNQKLGKIIKLNENKNHLDTLLGQYDNKLRIEYEKLNEIVKTKLAKKQKIPSLKMELYVINQNLARIDNLEDELKNKNVRLKDLFGDINSLRTRQRQYEADINDLGEKIKMLGTEESRCPICNSELGFKELEDLKNNLKNELENKGKSKAKDGNEMLLKMSETNKIEDEIRIGEATARKERAIWQNKLGINQHEMEDAESAAEELLTDEKKLEELHISLIRKEYLLLEQDELKKIMTELAEINYNHEAHERLKQEISALAQFEKLKEELNRASSLLSAEASSLKETAELLNNAQKALVDNEGKAIVLNSDIEKLNHIIDELTNGEVEYKSIQLKEAELRDNLAANQERLRYLSELENSIKENQSKCDLLRKEENIFRELSEAFSKRGIQALLIKQAFPEIEIEANRLLNRMTDNRLSLTLESQKELKSKKGEVIETLDIKISDELGTRNYEMFSGGESFRIDLALRIALSKLLVRRAGASLPILIIDEGFGTQDTTGRERLIEAIKSIEDDFEKIFVITHLEELKEYFPVIISVNKTIDGSTISVN